MQRALNLLRGVARVEVICLYPERFVNVCAMNGIDFWDMERDGNVLRAYIRASGFRALRELSPKYGFEITKVTKRGAPYFLRSVKKRYMLIAGALFVMLAVRSLALFVWDVRVHGNVNVPAGRILAELEDLGFGYGSYVLGVSSENLANEMLMRIPELSWLAINIRGSRAEILVRERVPKPEILDRSTPMMIVASVSGVITRVSVLEGVAQVRPGTAVAAGDILVSGIAEDRRGVPRAVRALADVEARTWRVLEAQMPLVMSVKRYTGAVRERRTLTVAGRSVNFYFTDSVPWENYDKTTTAAAAGLPGGAVLPITVVTERYEEYELIETEMFDALAENILKQELIARLTEQTGGGEILSMEFETRAENGVVSVTLKAECIENIGQERGFTAEEWAQLTIDN